MTDMTDEKTTIADLKKEITEFCSDRDWDQFHNQIEELMSGPGREEVADELSDTLYFIIRFAQMNGIDLSDSLSRKLAKNAEKYPASKVRGCNKKYDEY